MSDQPIIATVAHTRALHYCARGTRRWFALQGIEWMNFVNNGVSTQWLRQTNDAMACRLADYAEQQQINASIETEQ